MNEQLKGWISQQTNLEDYALAEFPQDTIDGIIPANSIILLSADPKAGKSFVAQSWAHSVATGTPWLGRDVLRGGVAWVNPDGEHPRFLWERFTALERYTGEKIPYKESLATLETFQISNSQQKENLMNGVQAGIKLVIIDSMAAAAGSMNLSNQNEFFEIGQFSKELILAGEKHGTSVVWICHTTKSDPEGISGSQQILAAASQHYSITNKKGLITLKLQKNRHGAADIDIPLVIETTELENGRTAGVIVSGDKARLKTTPNNRKAIEAILKLGVYEPGEQIPKATFAKELQAQGVSGSTAYRTLVGAVEDGLLVEHPSGKQMAYSFPVSQSFPKENLGEAQTTFSPLPEPLSSGIEKKGTDNLMEFF